MKPNQSHVAGLELALNALQDAHLWVGSAEVRKLIGQAKASPAAEPAIKESLTVEPMAYAVFADNGNVVCFSTVRDHHSLKALEAAGDAVVSLYTRPQDAGLVELKTILPALDDALETLEMHGRHSDQGYRQLKDWYRKIAGITARIDAKLASLDVRP